MSKYHLDSTQFTGEAAETAASKYSSHFCLSLHLPIYLSVYLAAWLSSCLPVALPVALPTCLPGFPLLSREIKFHVMGSVLHHGIHLCNLICRIFLNFSFH